MKRFNLLMSFLLVVGLLVVLPAFAAEMNHNNSPMMKGQKSSNSLSKSPLTSRSSNAIDLSYLLRKNVRNQQGRSIGRVADVVVGHDGRAEFVILSRSGVFHGHGKYIPIPWNTFVSHATNLAKLNESRSLTFSLAKAQLDKAPRFSSRKDFTSSLTRQKVCRYFKGQCAQNEFSPRSQSRERAS